MVTPIKIDKQRFRNTQIGVVGADMSVANSLSQISNTMNNLSNNLFKEAAVNAERDAREYVSSLSNDQIVGTDPETGAPVNLLNGLKEGLSTKGYGSIGRNTFDAEITQRFAHIIRQQYTDKAKRLALQHPTNPNKFNSEFSDYIDTLAMPYDGKFKNIVLDGGTEYGASVQTKLIGDAMENEKRMSNQLLAQEMGDSIANTTALGKETRGNNWERIIPGLADSSNPVTKNFNNRIDPSFRAGGGIKINSKEFNKQQQLAFASGGMQGIYSGLVADNDKGQIIAYNIQNALLSRQPISNEMLGDLPDKEKEKIQALVKVIRQNNAGAEVSGQLQKLGRSDNAIDTYLSNQQTKATNEASSSIVENRKTEQLAINTEFTIDGGAALTNVQKLINEGSPDQAFSTYKEGRQELIKRATSTLSSTTSDGRTVQDKQTVMTGPELRSALVNYDARIASMISTSVSSRFTEDGTPNIVKMESMLSYIANPSQPIPDSFTQEQKDFATNFNQFANQKNIPDSLVSEDISNLPIQFRSNIISNFGQSINNQKKALANQVARQKFVKFAEDMNPTNMKGIVGKTAKEDREMADQLLTSEFNYLFQKSGQNPNPSDINNIWFTPMFLNPNSPFRKRVDELSLKGNVVPQSLTKAIQDVRMGRRSTQQTLAIWDYINQDGGTLQGYIIQDDGSFRTTSQRRNMLTNHGLSDDMHFFAEVREVAAALGTAEVPSIIAQMNEYTSATGKDRDLLRSHYNRMYESDIKKDKNGEPSMSGRQHALSILADVAGGKYTYKYDFVEEALDYHVASTMQMNQKVDVEAWAENLFEQNFLSGEDIVLDLTDPSYTLGDQTPYSLLNIFSNETDRDNFKRYVDEEMLRVSENKLSLYGNDRGDMEDQLGFIAGVTNFFTAWQGSDKIKKGWIVPHHAASTTKLHGLSEMTPSRRQADQNNIVFTVSYGDNGQIQPFFMKDTKSKDKNAMKLFEVSLFGFKEWLDKQ